MSTLQPIEYESVGKGDPWTQELKTTLIRVLVIFWLIPFLGGSLIFGLWLNFRSIGLELAGFIMLFAGVVFFVIGVICVVAIATQKWRNAGRHRRTLLLAAVLSLVILASNFAVAAGILRAVDWVEQRWPLPNDPAMD